ncbi:hypothetical protein [Brevundimonas sp. FT23042]|uniref:hypothetical protein n=1 Tax=Brevundimonas sp. FT23042 TaxID=3393749 RepID=UPI003B5864B5
MILTLLAALVLQTPEPPDAAAATLDLSEKCLAVMTGRAEAPAAAWNRIALADGREATITIGRNGCSLGIDNWRDDGGAFATAVRDSLLAGRMRWTVSQWREPRASESGPALWSAMVIPDIRRHSAFYIQIVEPGHGAPERLEVSFGIAP